MEAFEFNVEIDADINRVRAAFWDLDDWPAIAPHVRAIEMLYSDDNVQVLMMHVATKKRLDKFKSVRVKQKDTIFYFQPTPPPILNRHEGSWRLAAHPSGTTVTSQHSIDVNVEAADAFLGETGDAPEDADETRRRIQDLIRNNSLQTMLALKRRLEQTNGGTHELQESTPANGVQTSIQA